MRVPPSSRILASLTTHWRGAASDAASVRTGCPSADKMRDVLPSPREVVPTLNV